MGKRKNAKRLRRANQASLAEQDAKYYSMALKNPDNPLAKLAGELHGISRDQVVRTMDGAPPEMGEELMLPPSMALGTNLDERQQNAMPMGSMLQAEPPAGAEDGLQIQGGYGEGETPNILQQAAAGTGNPLPLNQKAMDNRRTAAMQGAQAGDARMQAMQAAQLRSDQFANRG